MDSISRALIRAPMDTNRREKNALSGVLQSRSEKRILSQGKASQNISVLAQSRSLALCEPQCSKQVARSTSSSSKVYSLNIGNEKTSFYLRSELTEELKVLKSLETKQKPVVAINEMKLKDVARKHVSAIHLMQESSNSKTRNSLEFEVLMRGVSEGTVKISTDDNAGGNSVFSEALSFEVMKRLFSAELLKTEMEIDYCPGSKKTDYLVKIHGKKYGVSVTRAFNFIDYLGQEIKENTISDRMLGLLLRKKLSGIIASSENVYGDDVWEKQFLHCWVPSNNVAKRLKNVYQSMKCKEKSNTILLVTVASEVRSIFMEIAQDHL